MSFAHQLRERTEAQNRSKCVTQIGIKINLISLIEKTLLSQLTELKDKNQKKIRHLKFT